MSQITTIQGDLFTAPKGSILVHACNTKGIWGAGIAKQFAKRFPRAYETYAGACRERGSDLIGTCLLIPAGDYTVGCLFTSKNYGKFIDRPEVILKHTQTAIGHLLELNTTNQPIHMCKINSGLFGVPWRDTKTILKSFNHDFIVYAY